MHNNVHTYVHTYHLYIQYKGYVYASDYWKSLGYFATNVITCFWCSHFNLFTRSFSFLVAQAYDEHVSRTLSQPPNGDTCCIAYYLLIHEEQLVPWWSLSNNTIVLRFVLYRCVQDCTNTGVELGNLQNMNNFSTKHSD